MPRFPSVFAPFLLLCAAPAVAQHPTEPAVLEPRQTYVIGRAASPPLIDGRIEEAAWAAAPWTRDFVDIEGSARPAPPLRTRVRMLWDDEFLYIAAELTEPHVWGTLTERDAVIFQDDDFEVFIDPDGDTHAYYELEVNALGTVWDLLLTMPYRDGGRAIDHWDIRGLRVGVHVAGTLNDGRDTDRGWSVELALPWRVLREAAPERRTPRPGEQWRMNFSRVDWDVTPADGGYPKRRDADGKPLPEHNWVWSPQGAVNMHMPERWGIVRFAAAEAAAEHVLEDAHGAAADALRALYYAQRRYRAAHGRYARTLDELEASAALPVLLETTQSGYELSVRSGGVRLHMDDRGRTWRTEEER